MISESNANAVNLKIPLDVYIFSSENHGCKNLKSLYDGSWYDAKIINYICDSVSNRKLNSTIITPVILNNPKFEFKSSSLLVIPHKFITGPIDSKNLYDKINDAINNKCNIIITHHCDAFSE
jgi:hypothetical protein